MFQCTCTCLYRYNVFLYQCISISGVFISHVAFYISVSRIIVTLTSSKSLPPCTCDVYSFFHSLFLSLFLFECALTSLYPSSTVTWTFIKHNVNSSCSTKWLKCSKIHNLLRLRDGKSTEDNWTTLLQRTPAIANNANDFNDVTLILQKKEHVAKYNYEAITKLGTPIARINTIHSCTAKSDEAGGLQPVIFIAKRAKVMAYKQLMATDWTM